MSHRQIADLPMTSTMNKDESDRLMAVERFLSLDFSHEQELQNIVILAAEICQTPVALITLLGETEQTFKFKVGTELSGTARNISFCNETILGDQVMVVPDLSKDPRFVENPLVTGPANVRFYAGSPIVTDDGYSLGSLCVVDTEPKELSEKQQQMLQMLSKQAIILMELQRSIKMLTVYVDELEVKKNEIERSEKKISAQYDALMKIAQIQSHEFRRPVASILGLISLINDDISSRDECIPLLEIAARELDEKIHDITNYTQGDFQATMPMKAV